MSYQGSKEIIAGIDLSLTATGLTIVDGSGKIVYEELFNTKQMRGMQRLFFIKSRIQKKLKDHNVTKVAIESYSFGSKGRSVVSLGELGGVIRMMLFENNYTYFDCPPTSLKAYIAGKGNADKDQMKAAVLAKYGIDYDDDNVCDSFSLSRMLFEVGDEMKVYCAEGGARLIRAKRENEIRKNEGKKGNFVELLKLGVAKTSDVKVAVLAHAKQKESIPVHEFLGIQETEYKKLAEKALAKNVKQLNREYSY